MLVVDDDEDIRDLVANYLGRQGLRVVEATSEAQLLAGVAQNAPDVILLDVNLGSEDGFAIARRLRSHGLVYLGADGAGGAARWLRDNPTRA